MELGEATTYEAWVLRYYGQLALYSDGHESAEDAFKHARLGGWDANRTEVVRVKSIRQRVTPNAEVRGKDPVRSAQQSHQVLEAE